MARVKFGSVISEVSGSIAGVTFQKYYGGSSIRKKPLPSKSASQSQVIARNFVAQVQQSWASLTDAQRQSWSSFLSYAPAFQSNNKKVVLKGYSLFLKYNLLRLHAGFTILTAISYAPLDLIIPEWSLTLDEGTSEFYFYFDSGVDPASYGLLIKASPSRLNPSLSSLSRMRVMAVQSYGVAYDTYRIDNAFEAIFGVLPSIGDKLLVEMTLFLISAPIIAAPFRSIATVIEA
jgi:hypothetical protein